MFNTFKKKSTIFWMNYRTPNGEGDRRQYFEGKKTLKDLHDWVEEQRNSIMKARVWHTDQIVVTNIGHVKENY